MPTKQEWKTLCTLLIEKIAAVKAERDDLQSHDPDEWEMKCHEVERLCNLLQKMKKLHDEIT